MPPRVGPDDRDVTERLIGEIYQSESRRVLATLIRLLGDFDLAEEATHDAFTAALEQWPRDGVPTHPRGWLVSTGRFKGLDARRRRARFPTSVDANPALLQATSEPEEYDDGLIHDDHLRLIFTCCHPALPLDGQMALTLREVCGLTTEEIASAFLASPRTIAQRIVRAKGKIRDAQIPYQVPDAAERSARVDVVLHVVYLMFNEGYSASRGDAVVRLDLTKEAIRLGRLLHDLLAEPEATGLLALMLLHESRRRARTSADGQLVLLEDQDRSLWDRALIDEGSRLVDAALATRRVGPYTLQAAIAAVHAAAASPGDTDWREIVGLYDVLLRVDASPVVRLNRAVAVAMRDGAAEGLAEVEALSSTGALDDYHLLHAARADLCRRLGRLDQARQAYERAWTLARQEPERRFLRRRIEELGTTVVPSDP